MKKLLIILLIISTCVIFTACRESSPDSIEARKFCNFKKLFANIDVGLGDEDDIFVDVNTNVMYVRDWHNGLSPIYNADGRLKLWKGEIPE